jgi:hypothetical protein
VAIYQSLAAGAAPAAPPGTAPAAPAAPAAAVTTPGARLPVIDPASFDKLYAVAGAQLSPALRFTDNEVTLSSNITTPWVGIGAILSPDEPGSVIVSGNRGLRHAVSGRHRRHRQSVRAADSGAEGSDRNMEPDPDYQQPRDHRRT